MGDTAVLALTVLVCGLLGLPPVNGVLPQSPMHVQACAICKKKKPDGDNSEESSVAGDLCESQYEGVYENRVSSFLQSALCFLPLVILPAIREIPISILWGFFLYFGISSFYGNQMMGRALSFLSPSSSLPASGEAGYALHFSGAPRAVTFWFTLVQFLCLGVVLWWSEFAEPFLLRTTFAIIILLLIPLRRCVLPLVFSGEHLALLDGHGEADDERDASTGDLEASHERASSTAYPSRSSVRTFYKISQHQAAPQTPSDRSQSMVTAMTPTSPPPLHTSQG